MAEFVAKIYKGVKRTKQGTEEPIYFNSKEAEKIKEEFVEIKMRVRGIKIKMAAYLDNNYYVIIEFPKTKLDFFGNILNSIREKIKQHTRTVYVRLYADSTIESIQLEKGVSLKEFH